MWVWFLSDDPYHITWKEKFGSKPLKRENQPKIFQSPSHRMKLYQLPVCQSAILRTPHLTNNRGKKNITFSWESNFRKGNTLKKLGNELRSCLKRPLLKNSRNSYYQIQSSWPSNNKNPRLKQKNTQVKPEDGDRTPKIMAPQKKIHVLQLIAWSLSGSIRLLLISSQRYLVPGGFSGVCPGFFSMKNPSFGLVRKSFKVGPWPLGLVLQLGTVTPPKKVEFHTNLESACCFWYTKIVAFF